jgi:hypothetical protein
LLPSHPVSLRRSLLSGVFALWFVVLIVLPFTAPFQVWSDEPVFSKTQGDDLKSSDKLSKDAAIAVSSPSAEVLSQGLAVQRRPAHGRSVRHTLPTVLSL